MTRIPDRAERRRLLRGAALLPLAAVLLPGRGFTQQAFVPLTPECRGRAERTPAQGEGPYYSPNTPQRANLNEPGAKGTPLVLVGLVLNSTCQPVRNALLDVWHCDAEGNYDNTGYRYRGHQFTDEAGRYRLETVVPGLYPGRTRHIHVKLQAAPGRRLLTTQLYFPDEPGNRRDWGYRRELTIRPAGAAPGAPARFDFVVEA